MAHVPSCDHEADRCASGANPCARRRDRIARARLARRGAEALFQLGRGTRGQAAVEFALILPVFSRVGMVLEEHEVNGQPGAIMRDRIDHGATMNPTRKAGAIDLENEPIWMTPPFLLMA